MQYNYNYLSFFYDVVALNAMEIIRITLNSVEYFLPFVSDPG